MAMKEVLILSIYFLSIFVLTTVGGDFVPSEIYRRMDYLDKRKEVKLFWKFDEIHITFEVHVKTTGWVGLGFSPKGGMKNADIIIGWVSDGKVTISDRHGPMFGNGFPDLDADQNIETFDGRECNGVTMIKFKRKLKTCDQDYDQTIGEDTIRLIYAFGLSDPVNDTLSISDMHAFSNRGSKSAVLLSGSIAPPVYANERHYSFDILNNGTDIPTQETFYNCRLIKLPILTKKHHIIKMEPLVDEKFIDNVHHIVINRCGKPPNDSLVGSNVECYGDKAPRDCSYIIAGWAVGGGDFYFPEDAGLPLGTPDSPTYVVIETHYDNPMGIEIRDFSGFRIHYTPDLRKHDAGTLTVGHITTGFELVIPPKQDKFTVLGQCDAECLAAGMEAAGLDNITLFATFPHTHLAGRSIRTRHIRNGTELPLIAKDDSYDFDYQETRALTKYRVVQKGDTLITQCTYSTAYNTKTTFGGLGTSNEMCLTFLYYYPYIPVKLCIGSPSATFNALATIVPFYSVSYKKITTGMSNMYDLVITSPGRFYNETLGDAMNQIDWTKPIVDSYNQQIRKGKQRQHCGSFEQTNIERDRLVDLVNIASPYVESEKSCTPSGDSLNVDVMAAECPSSDGSGVQMP